MANKKADGAAGSRRAAALLGIAACAEMTTTTLSEDAAKVDMKLSFRDAFRPERLLTIHAQVKSGRSYRSKSSSSQTLTLNIDAETVTALAGSANPGLAVWVPPPPLERLYWYASDPRRPLRTTVKIERHQFVKPSIRFDLTRLCTYASWNKSFPMQMVRSEHDAKIVLQRAKTAYAQLKAEAWVHPLAGRLQVTRYAWRHVTRLSKSTARRIRSLSAVPYLKFFLAKSPDRFVRNQGPIVEQGRETIDQRFLLFWYRDALVIDGEKYSLLLRVKEEGRYPKNWQNRPLAVNDVKQNATLVSWWCKKHK